jgi:hypothetical protein
MTIPLINEVAKLKVSSSGSSGGGGSQYFGDGITFIDKKHYKLSNLSNTSLPQGAQSSSYQRSFSHGSGQFSSAAIPFYETGSTTTQFYVQPFSVNQTTGAITGGTGTAIWTNSSGNCQSTMNWGSAGPYAFNWGQHCAPGYSSNTGIATAWTVSNNVASGTYYTDGNSSWPANGNRDSAVTISGGTYYWAPSANQGGVPRNLVFSYNGSSLTRTRNNDLSSYDTSTNYVAPVVRQFGNQAATQGTIHIYRQSNERQFFNILGPTMNIQSTVGVSSTLGIPISSSMPEAMIGLELSNGRQLFYSKQWGIVLRDGTSLTNVSGSADFVPNMLARTGTYTAVAQDTWVCLSESSPRELVKFSINPTTYKVTILGSVPISLLTKSEAFSNSALSTGGVFLTGTTNQFVVVCGQVSSNGNVVVMVGQHGL